MHVGHLTREVLPHRARVAYWRIHPAVEVGGGGRECGSGDQRWIEVGEAAFVWCGKVMIIPRRMEAGLLCQ